LKRASRFLIQATLIFFTVKASLAGPIPPTAAAGAESTVASRRQQLLSLFDEQWEYELRVNPEFATSLGDRRYNDRLNDHSLEFYKSDLEKKRQFLARIEAIDPAGFDPQDALSRTLMIRSLREEMDGARFKSWEMPVNQMGGPHLHLPELVSLTPFDNSSDYENYISRLHQIPRVFDQVMGNMRQGMKDGLMPPKYLLEKVTAEAEELAGKTGEASPFAGPVKHFPTAIAAADQKKLRESILSAINDQVVPSYRRFAAFVHDEYAPRGRKEPGVWSLHDGAERYKFAIQRITTTDLTPEQIHEIGLKQIAETETQMMALAHKLGFKDLASLNEHIKNDRQLYA
jgi:uncharacterized protein (DUF885 family)